MGNTKDERQLGLDSSKFTQKKWNPQDYTGSSGIDPTIRNFINQVRNSYSPERSEIERKMAQMGRGGVSLSDLAVLEQLNRQDDSTWYSQPKQKDLIRELGLQVDSVGNPILDDEDEERVRGTTESLDSTDMMDMRTKLLFELLGE
jgi:hypothetical protein